MRGVRLLTRQFVCPLPEGCAMQPLLPMLVRDPCVERTAA